VAERGTNGHGHEASPSEPALSLFLHCNQVLSRRRSSKIDIRPASEKKMKVFRFVP
jgi:hypothetical protein